MWKATVKKVAALIADMFGSGFGAHYKAWLRLRRGHFIPASTHGRNHCSLTGRPVENFASVEREVNIAVRFVRALEVWDQKPLWPHPSPHPLGGHPDFRDFNLTLPPSIGTIAWCRELGIDPPTYVGSNAKWIITSDVMAVFRDREQKPLVVAIHVKPSRVTRGSGLDMRPAELAEIERRAAEEMGMRFLVVDEKTLPEMLTQNLIAMYPGKFCLSPGDEHRRFADFCMRDIENYSISELQSRWRQRTKAVPEHVASLWKQCVWHRLIPVDLRKPRLYTYPAPLADESWVRQLRSVFVKEAK